MPDDITTTPSPTQISPDGRTYRHKTSGSPFNGSSTLPGQTMSCFLCGMHRSRSMLRSRRLIGRHRAVCAPSCQKVGEPAGVPSHAAVGV